MYRAGRSRKLTSACTVRFDMVDDRIAAGGANAADLTTLIVESLVDIILRVPEEEQAQFMAHTLAALGDF
jgi:hypothetical protein